MCAPDMDLGAREVDLDALEVDLVALGVGLGAPGVHLAWVLLPASGALKICYNSNFYGARFLVQAQMVFVQNSHPFGVRRTHQKYRT